MLSISCNVIKYLLKPQTDCFLWCKRKVNALCNGGTSRWLLVKIQKFGSNDDLVKVGNIWEVQFSIKLFTLLFKESVLIVCSEQFKIVDHVHKLFFWFLLFDWPQANWLPVVISESLMGVTRRIYRKSTNVFVIVPMVTTGICSERTQRPLLSKWSTDEPHSL